MYVYLIDVYMFVFKHDILRCWYVLYGKRCLFFLFEFLQWLTLLSSLGENELAKRALMLHRKLFSVMAVKREDVSLSEGSLRDLFVFSKQGI